MTNNIYKRAYSLVNANLKILSESDMSAMVVLSPAGLGKTTLVFKAMEKEGYRQGEHFLYYNSYFTPLAFYQTLAETTELKKPKILILDDVETILKDKKIINLLKSATWENEKHKRVVNYVSTSTKVKDTQINFDGKIILLVNETPDGNPMFKAIVDRVLFCELNFSQQEILELMSDEIVKQEYQGLSFDKRQKIFHFIKSNVNPDTTLSFRTLIKAYNNFIYAPNHWQELTKQSLGSKQNKKIKQGLV